MECKFRGIAAGMQFMSTDAGFGRYTAGYGAGRTLNFSAQACL